MYGFEAVIFKGKRTAYDAFDTLQKFTPPYAWIDDVAVISRNKVGLIEIHSTWAQDDSIAGAGTGLGMVTGGLLGLLLGPAGALAGMAGGGSLGLLMGAGTEAALDDPRLDDFAHSLDKDTSALILVGEKATIADFGSVVEPLGGKIVKSDLSDDDVKAIRNALTAKAKVKTTA